MNGFIDVYDKRTGAKHTVPEHWLDNPRLSKNISKTPRQKAREAGKPKAPATGDKEE